MAHVWSFQRPPAPRGDGVLSCASPAPAPLIDVASLSRGLADGVYFAGRQLTPWMLFEELCELSTLRYRHGERLSERGDVERRRELLARWQGQSMVVKWAITDGRPSAPEPLRNRYSDGLGDEDARPFTWGSGTAEDSSLVHCLLEEVLDDWHGRHNSSSNDYYHNAETLAKGFGPQWLLPRRRIEEVIARRDLLSARRALDEAEGRARAVGLDPAAVPAEAR